MKSFLATALAATLISIPVISFAGGVDGQLSRADVNAQLAALEQTGYQPSAGEHTAYPADIQLAENEVSQSSSAGNSQAGMTDGGYGGMAMQSSAGGQGMPAGHMSPCVGPTSFCELYFGS
jgi:hypothetical protein